MKEEENWRIKYLKFLTSKSYTFPIEGAGWVLLSNACALYHNDIYFIKKTYNSKKLHDCCVFLMQQLMMVKYIHIIMSKKTKIKVLFIWMTFMCKDLYCTVIFYELQRKRKKESNKNTLCINSYSQYVCAAVILILSYFNIHVWFHFIDDLVFTCSC